MSDDLRVTSRSEFEALGAYMETTRPDFADNLRRATTEYDEEARAKVEQFIEVVRRSLTDARATPEGENSCCDGCADVAMLAMFALGAALDLDSDSHDAGIERQLVSVLDRPRWRNSAGPAGKTARDLLAVIERREGVGAHA